MSPGRANLVLLLALAATVGLNLSLRHDPTQRNLEFFPEMVESVAAEPYSASPTEIFADGKTMRDPVPGTIPRGHMPLHYTARGADAVRAGRQLVNPFSPDDAEALARGAEVYATFCVTCHGGEGLGDGPVIERGVPPPPSLHGPRSLRMRDGEMFHIMTYGRRNMASFAPQISREDRWKAILHVRSLQEQAPAPAAPAQP